MKTLILSLSVAALLSGASAMAQSTATTTPVGFISETVAGGSLTTPSVTLISPTLTQPVVFQGTISSVSGTTITINGAAFTANQFGSGQYFVEVFSATKSGVLSDINSNGVNTVVTADDLTASASVGDSIAIRKYVTISDLFGATNTFGLLASDDPATADEVLIYSGGSNVTSYFYYTGSPGFPAGWWDSGFNGQAGSTTIAPDDGVVVRRKAAGSVTIVSTGTVKTGNTMFTVYSGLNVIGTIAAAGLTLDSSNLYKADGSGIHASDDPATGDEVILYGATGPVSYFYYVGSPGFPAGWWDSGFNGLAGSTAIVPGTSFVVRRKVAGNFSWSVPSPTSF